MNQYIEIDLKDLLCYIFKHIVEILVVALFLSVIGLAFAYVDNKEASVGYTTNILDVDTRLPDESDEEYYNRVNTVNQAYALVDSIDALHNQIAVQNNYLSSSLLMQLDPVDTATSQIQISIIADGDSNPYAQSLRFAYIHGIVAGDYIDNLSQELDIDASLIRELIFINDDSIIYDDSSTALYNDQYVYEPIRVSVVGSSTEFTDRVIDCIIDEVYDLSNQLDSSIASHSILVSERQSFVGYNAVVRRLQYNAVDTICALQNQIYNENNFLDNVAKRLKLNDKTDFYEPSSVSVSSNGDSMKTSLLKYGALGFVLGGLLGFIFFLLKYNFGLKLVSRTQFSLLFRDVDLIGVVKPIGKRSLFDEFLDRITGDDTKTENKKNNELIANNYSNVVSGLGKIIITGSNDSDLIRGIVNEIGLAGDVRLNIFDNPSILNAVPKYDGILLIEQRGVSDKRAIREELKLLGNSGTKVVGAIIL